MPSRFTFSDHTSWAARLQRSGIPLTVECPAPLPELYDIPEFPGSAESWNEWEHHLWNDVLPLQAEDGFGTSGDAARDFRMAAAVFACIRDDTLAVALPADGAGSGTVAGVRVNWSLETRYPALGALELILTPEQPVRFQIALRLPHSAYAAQLQQNGIARQPTPVEGWVALDAEWRAGDRVSLRFGIPFRVVPEGRDPLRGRAIERSYPGAASTPNAMFYHGLRRLDPVAYDRSCEGIVEVGVRKDGSLLLHPADPLQTHPFAAEGDFYRGSGDTPGLIQARSTRLNSPVSAGPLQEVRYSAYETAFDHGAS